MTIVLQTPARGAVIKTALTSEDEKKRKRGLRFIFGAAGVFAIAIATLFIAEYFSAETRALRRALPELEVLYPRGRELEHDFTGGVFGAGAAQKRTFCVTDDAPQIIAFFESELSKRGFARATATPSQHFRADAIAQFDKPPFSYRLYLRDRQLGRVGPYCRAGERYLFTRLENADRF